VFPTKEQVTGRTLCPAPLGRVVAQQLDEAELEDGISALLASLRGNALRGLGSPVDGRINGLLCSVEAGAWMPSA
jgi:hypothetical protein